MHLWREERLYAQQDANWNTATVVGLSGGVWQVLERYQYDPFGQRTVTTPTYGSPGTGSAYAWVVGFQGLRYSQATGLYHARNRDYSATLGRWVSVDPIGYSAGDVNLFRFVGNGPTGNTDPTGLQASGKGGPPTATLPPGVKNPIGPMGGGYTPPYTLPVRPGPAPQPPVPGAVFWGSQGGWLIPCPKTRKNLLDLPKNPAFKGMVSIKLDPWWATEFFHPGAAQTWRILIKGQTVGNQCAYNCEGNLIPTGPAAGTADAETGLLPHLWEDVLPWFWKPLDKYHDERPPFNAPANPSK